MIFTAAAVIKMFQEEIHRAFMNQAQIPPTVSFSFSEKQNPKGPGTGGGRLFSLELLCSETSVLEALGGECSLATPSLLIL